MIKAYFINSTLAKYNDSEFAWFQSLMMSVGIIGNPSGVLGLGVTQSGTPGMNVAVAIGKALVEITKVTGTFKVVVDNDAVVTVPITSNSTGANRVDAIVVRVNTATEPNSLKNNVATIECVLGTGVSALSDGAITTALGSDGWYRLANVTVANGASSILNASIGTVSAIVSTNQAFSFNGITPTGLVSPFAGRSAPSGWLLCDGSAVSRSTYLNLFNTICPASVFTVTIATPGVVTSVGHGLVAGDKIHFTTSGALPTGLSAGVEYYVLSTSLTTDTFRLALSPEGTAINTTGSQSGTHTMYRSAYGIGDGSSTFNVPDLRSKAVIGRGTVAPTITVKFESGAVNTGSDTITLPNGNFPKQGQKVRLTTLGTLPTGLAINTDYYVIRTNSTTIKLATSQANANGVTPTAIDITGAGSGTHTIVYTQTSFSVLGENMGEEDHGLSVSEMASHFHTVNRYSGASFSNNTGGGQNANSSDNTTSTGGDAVHNNMQPSAVLNYIIKI